MRRAIALVIVSLLLSGCAEAMFSRVSMRSHAAYSDGDLALFRTMRSAGSVHKGDVLATLGHPTQVIGQDTGDVFVYRRRFRQENVINLDPSVVSGLGPTVPIPIFFRNTTTGRNDTLMLFFDTDGRLLGDSLLRGIEAPAGGEGE